MSTSRLFLCGLLAACGGGGSDGGGLVEIAPPAGANLIQTHDFHENGDGNLIVRFNGVGSHALLPDNTWVSVPSADPLGAYRVNHVEGAVGFTDSQVLHWDSGSYVGVATFPASGVIDSIVVATDGRVVALHEDGNIVVASGAQWQTVIADPGIEYPRSAAREPNGALLLLGRLGLARVSADVTTSAVIAGCAEWDCEEFGNGVLAQNGDFYFYGGKQQTLGFASIPRLFRVRAGASSAELLEADPPATYGNTPGFAVAPDGTVYAIWSSGTTVTDPYALFTRSPNEPGWHKVIDLEDNGWHVVVTRTGRRFVLRLGYEYTNGIYELD